MDLVVYCGLVFVRLSYIIDHAQTQTFPSIDWTLPLGPLREVGRQ